MPYNTKAIITDVNGKAIPQYWDEVLDRYVPLPNNQPIVEDYHEGNTNVTKNYSYQMNGVSIANDGLNNLTFIVNGVTRTVFAGEVYNGTLPPFTSITVNATDFFRMEVLR
ncbi:hypothetical protein [Bacillus sp. 03113]|uniref:hypothetical protein n=1 Tax=Bacillus sp. 03113 TaxID=2578211 RepID=UPI001141A4CA|nr:hypothetical protein [Bacillus sp. 03113]